MPPTLIIAEINTLAKSLDLLSVTQGINLYGSVVPDGYHWPFVASKMDKPDAVRSTSVTDSPSIVAVFLISYGS